MTDCVHNWIPSEGRTASGVICSKCWDYNGPQAPKKHKLKVLSNPYQTSVTLWQWKNKRRANEGLAPVEFEFILHYPAHEVIFNRPGFYLTADDCWLEFDMGECVTKAIAYDREDFQRKLREQTHLEKLMSAEDWDNVKGLLRRGIIPWTDHLREESWHQHSKQIGIDMGKRMMESKKRLRQKIKEKKNG